MHSILALATKDLRLLFRDKGGFFVAFVFPLVYCVFFGVIFAERTRSAGPLCVALIDEDNSPESQRLLDRFTRLSELTTHLTTRAEAAESLRLGQCAAFVRIPKGYGLRTRQLLLGERALIYVGSDPARQTEAAYLTGLVERSVTRGLVELISSPVEARRVVHHALDQIRTGRLQQPGEPLAYERFLMDLDRFLESGSLAANSTGSITIPGTRAGSPSPDSPVDHQPWQPVTIQREEMASGTAIPQNSYAVSFPQGIIWGVLGCAASFGISMVTERNEGTLARLRTAPITQSQILAGKALACYLATLGVSVTLFTLAILFFGVRPDAYAKLAVSIGLVSFAFTGIMMLLSTLGRTERQVSGFTWAILLGMAMTGGAMVPLFAMPAWLQALSHASPVKWAILSMEGAVWRGFTTAEMIIPWTILASVGLVTFGFGTRVFRWMEAS